MTQSYQQNEQPRPVPQALQLEFGRSVYRWVLLHANLASVYHSKRQRGRPAGHVHPETYHVFLYTSGRGQALLEGRLQPVRPGTLVLSAPGDRHDFHVDDSAEIHFAQITFAMLSSGNHPLALTFHEMLGLFAGLNLAAKGTVFHINVQQTKSLNDLIAGSVEAAQSPSPLSQLRLRQAVGQLFTFLIREIYLDNHPVAESFLRTRLDTARAYIEAHYREKITIPSLARISALSEGYFLRAFKNTFGLSPITCQTTLRVNAAKELLRFSTLSCKEIAEQLGYSDGYHFSKSFKKATGIAPRDYRNALDPI